jgi:hypothetical protein
MDPGLIGAIAGSLIGGAGGLTGTCFSIRNTNGPRERAFVIRTVIMLWIGVAAFLAAMLFLREVRSGYGFPVVIGSRFRFRPFAGSDAGHSSRVA